MMEVKGESLVYQWIFLIWDDCYKDAVTCWPVLMSFHVHYYHYLLLLFNITIIIIIVRLLMINLNKNLFHCICLIFIWISIWFWFVSKILENFVAECLHFTHCRIGHWLYYSNISTFHRKTFDWQRQKREIKMSTNKMHPATLPHLFVLKASNPKTNPKTKHKKEATLTLTLHLSSFLTFYVSGLCSESNQIGNRKRQIKHLQLAIRVCQLKAITKHCKNTKIQKRTWGSYSPFTLLLLLIFLLL